MDASAYRRRRPSPWWFAAGGALVVAALAAFVGLFLWTLGAAFDIEENVRADGQPQRVELSGDERRTVWARSEDSTDCTIVDTRSGEEVDYSPVGGSFTKSDSSGTWTAIVNFEPGSGVLDVTCVDAGGQSVQIGPATSPGSFVGRILATVFVPLVLGGLGVIVLIVTGVLTANGAPRRGPVPAGRPTAD